MKAIKVLIAIQLLMVAAMSPVWAQDNTGNQPPPEEHEMWGWTGGFGATHFVLDKNAAASQSVDDTAFSVDLFASYYFSSRLVATAGLGFVQLDDKAEFSQTVLATSLLGSDVETATSETSALHMYVEALYLSPPVSALAMQFRAGAGYGTIGYADRSIKNCSNCRKEDIDFKGGVFVTGGIFKDITSSPITIGLSAKQYFSSDVKTSATLWFEYVN